MSRPSMLWLYGLIGAFIIGYYVFGDVNDTSVSSDSTTVEQMVEKDEVDMDIKMLYVEAYAREHKTFSFRKLLEKQNSKMEVIVTFLIILELMKTGKINISQENIFDDIMITSNV